MLSRWATAAAGLSERARSVRPSPTWLGLSASTPSVRVATRTDASALGTRRVSRGPLGTRRVGTGVLSGGFIGISVLGDGDVAEDALPVIAFDVEDVVPLGHDGRDERLSGDVERGAAHIDDRFDRQQQADALERQAQ